MVERHLTELRRYPRSLLRDSPTADDAVQTAFESAFVAPESTHGSASRPIFAPVVLAHHTERGVRRLARSPPEGGRDSGAGEPGLAEFGEGASIFVTLMVGA